jgi:hypothetical protein
MVEQTTDEQRPAVDRQAVADEFVRHAQGKLEQDKVDAAVAALKAADTSYPANGSVASFMFYLQFQVTIKDGGKTFNGKAGGITTPGGGALWGDVYTDDLDRLYAATKSFEFQATSVYTSLLFFDGSSNLLGHFESGSVSTVNGVGGGSGGWS